MISGDESIDTDDDDLRFQELVRGWGMSPNKVEGSNTYSGLFGP